MANSILKAGGVIKVGSLASDPSSPENGFIYYNTSSNVFRFYQNGGWTTMSAGEVLTSTFRIDDSTDSTKKIAFDAASITTATTRTITMPDSNVDLGLVGTALQTSQLGANNGVASLDAGGKIPTSQLPALAITSVSVVLDNTARDALTVQEGDLAVVTSTGKTFVYDGSAWVEITASGAVTSVNGQTGTVSLTTDNVSEGSTNLYFTDTRAKTAAVVNSLGGSQTDQAPSVSSVNTALSAKLSSVSQDTAPTLGGDLTLNSKSLMGPMDRSATGSPANYVQEEYLHSITLTGSSSGTNASSLNFAFATFGSIKIDYQIKEATTNRMRQGTLRITSNGTDIGMSDVYSETGDVGVVFDAVISGSNVNVNYTTTANNKTMRADIKRFLA